MLSGSPNLEAFACQNVKIYACLYGAIEQFLLFLDLWERLLLLLMDIHLREKVL
jgi:hypothetical protein